MPCVPGTWRKFEDTAPRSATKTFRRSIQIASLIEYEVAHRSGSVVAIESQQDSFVPGLAGRGEFENDAAASERATPGGVPVEGCAVQVSSVIEDHASQGTEAVTVRICEQVQLSFRPASVQGRCEFKDRTATRLEATLLFGSPKLGRTIEVSNRIENQTGCGSRAVRAAGKAVEDFLGPRSAGAWYKLKHGATPVIASLRTAGSSRTIEISILIDDQAAGGPAAILGSREDVEILLDPAADCRG
jgi:hypothetical protein